MLSLVKACLSQPNRDALRFNLSRISKHKNRFVVLFRYSYSILFLKKFFRSFNFFSKNKRSPEILSNNLMARVEFLQVNQEVSIDEISNIRSTKLTAIPKLYGRPKIWYQPHRPQWTRDAYIAKIDNVYLTHLGQVFDFDFRSVFTLWNRRDYRLLQVLKKVSDGIELKFNIKNPPLFDEVVNITQSTSSVYGHFLIEVLPRFSMLNRQEFDRLPVYVNLDHEVYKEVFSLLGLSNDRIIDSIKHPIIKVNKAIIPVYHHASECSLPSFGVDVISRIKEKVLSSNNKGNKMDKRLYIRKNDSGNRKITNESEVLTILKSYGFVSINPSELSFSEQVRIFANAEHVIGEHGSGMFNCVFCSKNAHIIDLFPGCVNSGLYRVLVPLGIRYEAMLSPENSFVTWKHNLSFKVDIIELKAMLDDVFHYK